MESTIKLQSLPKQTVFKIPDGYFDLLLLKIHTRLNGVRPDQLDDKKPLLDYSVIEDISHGSIFITPPDYFENLYNRILTKLNRNNEDNKLDFVYMRDFESDPNNDKSYIIPDNYFENLSNRILARIDVTEKRESLNFSVLDDSGIGILAGIPKKNIFEVPENYFEKLSIPPEIKLSGEILEKQETKVIRLIPGWARYATAIAASVVLLLTAGYWFYPKETQSECTELLCNLSDEEILHYLEKQDVRLSGTQLSNPVSTHLDGNILEQSELSDDELLNAIEGIE